MYSVCWPGSNSKYFKCSVDVFTHQCWDILTNYYLYTYLATNTSKPIILCIYIDIYICVFKCSGRPIVGTSILKAIYIMYYGP